jgi:hypothetical protein
MTSEPPTEDEPAASPASSKIDPDLAMQLDFDAGAAQRVVVTFREPLEADAVTDLGLLPAGPNMATGSLEPAAIQRLAERPDVVRVSWTPPPRLLNLD